MIAGRKCRYTTIAGLIVLLLCGWTTTVSAGEDTTTSRLLQEIDTQLANGGYVVQCRGRILSSHNKEKLLVPASIIKIATSLAALHILGPEYRFATGFYITRENDLYIKGGGDPFLVSEEVALIIDRLLELGVREIGDIVLDDSAFRLTAPADGINGSENPYDAENSALAVNFNTVHFTKGVDSVQSAEPQTPTVPLMAELGADMAPGTYRINVSGGVAGKQVIGRYAGELFRALQQRKKIAGRGGIRQGRVPPGLPPLYVHRSSVTVRDGLERLLLYSNNFIANQLFLASGMERFGPPATWQKGREALQEFLQKEMGLGDQEIIMVEGSGLSRENRITPRAMLHLLDSFKPYANLLPRISKGNIDIVTKSGTLTGVYAYAGYFIHERQVDGYVLILNQKKNTRDRLLGLLTQLYNRKIEVKDLH